MFELEEGEIEQFIFKLDWLGMEETKFDENRSTHDHINAILFIIILSINQLLIVNETKIFFFVNARFLLQKNRINQFYVTMLSV